MNQLPVSADAANVVSHHCQRWITETSECSDLPLEDIGLRNVRRTGDSHYEPESDILYLSERHFDQLTHFAHELQHFFFHAGTPYGHLLDELALGRQFLGRNYMEVTEGPVIYPAFLLAKRLDRGSLQIRDGEVNREALQVICDRIVFPWHRVRYLENLLEGQRCASMLTATTRSAIEALSVAETLVSETVEMTVEHLFVDRPSKESVESLIVDSEDADLPVCPTIGLTESGERIPVGAIDIFEGVAQSTEGVAPEPGLGMEYILLWSHTLASMGFDGEMSDEEVEAARVTFLSLCDLALYVPAGAVYGRLRPAGMRWSDIHPGWRFLRCAQVISEIGLITSLERESNDLQTELSEGFGWPAPAEFHRLSAELKAPQFERHRAAMALRSGHADIWVEEREEHIQKVTAFIEKHSPMLIENGTVDPTLFETEAFLQKAFSAAISTILHAAMGALCPLQPGDLFPPGIGPETSAQLLETLKTLDWANPDRLVHIDAISVELEM